MSMLIRVGRGPSGASRQAAALRQEGVEVGRGHLGEFTVDFGTYGWFPSRLPSDDVESSEEEEVEESSAGGGTGT